MPEVGKKLVTRRHLIRGASVGLVGAAGAAVLAACGETVSYTHLTLPTILLV